MSEEVPIAEGRPKRERKEIQRMTIQETHEKVKLVVEPGSGVALGEFPFFVKNLEGHHADSDLVKGLHSLCFGVPGKKTETKKHLRQFSGFAPDIKDEKLSKTIENKKKYTVAFFKESLAMFGLSQSGTREELASKLIDYLDSPTITKSDGVVPKKAAGGGKGTKRKASSKKGGEKKAKKAPSGYNLFTKSKCAELKESDPSVSFLDLMKVVSAAWTDSSEAEKKKWNKKSAEEKARLAAAAEGEKAGKEDAEEEEEGSDEEGGEEEEEEAGGDDADILGGK